MEKTTLTNSYLNTLLQDIYALRTATETHFLNLSEAEFNWKPNERRWSVAECLQHLIITGKAYKKAYEQAMQYSNLPKIQANETHVPTFWGKIFLGFVDPKSKRKIPAPKTFKPKPATHFSLSLVEQYITYLDKLSQEIKQADAAQHSFNRIKISTPFSSWIRFNLGDYFEIHIRHNQRHFKQALGVMEESGFPKA